MAIDYTKAHEFDNGLQFSEGIWIGSGDNSPVVDLVDAPIGSRYYQTSGRLWAKHGLLNSAWCELPVRILTLGKNGASDNSWLRFHDGINSHQAPWIPLCDYEVIAVKYSNKNRGSSGDPNEVRISAYSEPRGTPGNIGTGDPVAWYVIGENSSSTKVYYEDRGRTWTMLADPGDTMITTEQYAFRIQLEDGSGSINDPHIEIMLRVK